MYRLCYATRRRRKAADDASVKALPPAPMALGSRSCTLLAKWMSSPVQKGLSSVLRAASSRGAAEYPHTLKKP